MIRLSAEEVLRLRQRRQLLGATQDGVGLAEVVHRLVGVQAQDLGAGRLGIGIRSPGTTAAEVEEARIRDRSIVRTWAMRATLHLLANEDYPWLRPLLAPRVIEKTRRRSAELGLDEETYSVALGRFASCLEGGAALTRSELAAELEAAGVNASGQRMPYLLLRASIQGLVCEGRFRSGKPAYVLAADWLGTGGETTDPEDGLERLVRRYLAGHGPASPEDFAWWAGWPLSQVRPAFRSIPVLTRVECEGRLLWDLPEPDSGAAKAPLRRTVLLPAFDSYLLGYKDRSLMLDPSQTRTVNAGGGMVRPVLLVDGRVQATWTMKRERLKSVIRIQPYRKLDLEVIDEAEDRAGRIGAFLGEHVRFEVGPGET